MKVLLINPYSASPYPVLPLGLAYIAAILEQNKIIVTILDAWAEGLEEEELSAAILKNRPDIIGITMTSTMAPAAMEVAAFAKATLNVPVVVGGPHASALPRECLANPAIDYVVIGEGEITFLNLIRTLSSGHPDLSTIKGIAYRNNNEIIVNKPAELMADLNDLPMPARHLFPVNKYRTHLPYGRKTPYMTMITSRGCPYHCIYCSKSVFGTTYRALSPVNVVRELKHLIETYKIREYRFYDDDFTLNVNRAGEICDEIIRQGIRLDWSCTTRVDLVNDELLGKMKRAGCYTISYGVESGDPEVLKNANKGYTLNDVEKTFRLTRKHGIKILAFFMLGLPGENEQTIEKSIRLALKLDPDFVSWGIINLMPGSKMYDDFPHQYNNRQSNNEKFNHPMVAGTNQIFFEGALPLERLVKYIREAHIRFYLRPRYLLKKLFQMRSWDELKGYAGMGFDFIKSIVAHKF